MKNIGIIQARMGSSRLFGKILYPLQGVPLLVILAQRIAAADVDRWWLATTDKREDDLTAAWGKALGWQVYRGETIDVLSRFTAIIKKEKPKYVVRLTADDPFTDSDLINKMLKQAHEMPSDKSLLAAGSGNGLPLGYSSGVVLAQRLLDIETEIPEDQSYHRSHVVSWLSTLNEDKRFVIPGDWPLRPNWRWTIDTLEDAMMAEAAFTLFGSEYSSLKYTDMVKRLDNRPDITSINANIRQKKLEEG
jgi:spore coat polysaccharide biosynthesis protein SpsF